MSVPPTPDDVLKLVETWTAAAQANEALARANGPDHPRLALHLVTEATVLAKCASELLEALQGVPSHG